MSDVVTQTNLDYPKKQGKVRDIYDLGDKLLLVATDRVSAFDVVFNEGIPLKGKCLNKMSSWWFNKLHVDGVIVADNAADFPDDIKEHSELDGRSVLMRKAQPLPIECIVRGYITGSAWRAYEKGEDIWGLPEGLQKDQKLPEPIFTPSTKAEQGEHDENITLEKAKELTPFAEEAARVSLELYKKASEIAEDKGIIICDTKIEFGVLDGKLVVIDELFTSDSSRFWYKKDYDSGNPVQMDKEYLRSYLLTLDWNKEPPAPTLPQEVVDELSRRYQEMFKSMTGDALV